MAAELLGTLIVMGKPDRLCLLCFDSVLREDADEPVLKPHVSYLCADICIECLAALQQAQVRLVAQCHEMEGVS